MRRSAVPINTNREKRPAKFVFSCARVGGTHAFYRCKEKVIETLKERENVYEGGLLAFDERTPLVIAEFELAMLLKEVLQIQETHRDNLRWASWYWHNKDVTPRHVIETWVTRSWDLPESVEWRGTRSTIIKSRFSRDMDGQSDLFMDKS